MGNRDILIGEEAMNNYLIDFPKMEWEDPSPGLRQKTHTMGNLKLRLVEFSEQFTEPDWCRKGHIGYVIEGQLEIDFDGKATLFKAGDGVYIPGGEASRHIAKIAKGEKALLVLIEKSA
jgi:quercetin dioxygenase-like cupin family protein